MSEETKDAETAPEAEETSTASAEETSEASESSEGAETEADDAAEAEEAAKPVEPVVETKAKAPAPRRNVRWQGWLAMIAGVVGVFLIMAYHEQIPRGPLWGILLTLFATLGFADVMGVLRVSSLTDDERARAIDWRTTWLGPKGNEPLFLAPIVSIPVAFGVAALGALQPNWAWLPGFMIGALLVLAPAAMRRPGLLVFVIGSGIVLPMLGAYGLWDPWETHYGEVAREMLSRDDWISTWWAHEEWFFSKPVFIFWIEALSMGALGVNFHPDMMIAPDAHGVIPHPEWALRFPHYILTLGAVVAIYGLISRVYGKRPGALAAIVVSTLPHFFMLSHQAITDMPLVSNMTMAMCMLGLAISEDGKREVRVYRLGPIAISARTLALGLLFAVCVPQALYLASRNVTLVTGGFTWHHDSFLFGSGGGNAGNPGNPPPRTIEPYLQGLGAEPIAQAIYWGLGLIAIVWQYRNEKRARAIAMLGFYLFCAFAFMAKGIEGFALPGMVALFFLISSRRWDLLLEGQFRVALGILVILVVGMPWYVAMFIRHGNAFTDRIFIHDHINRLTSGVHGDNASIEYFFEQLGYGMFPWIALAPLAIAAWVRFGTRKSGRVVRSAPRDVGSAPALDRSVWMGGLVALAGVALTVGGYEMASGAGGGSYIVFTGLIVAGVGVMLRGIMRTPAASSAPTDASAGEPVSVEVAADTSISDAQRDVMMIIGLWGTSAFFLFSAMTTKFHHYIFPAVPPSGILIGLALDPLLGKDPSDLGKRVLGTLAAVVSPMLVIVGVAGWYGDPRGLVPLTEEHPADWVLVHPLPMGVVVALILGGIVLAGLAWVALRPTEKQDYLSKEGWLASVALFCAPLLLAMIGRDLAWSTESHPWGMERLIHLFVYNYQRPWPPNFDYRPILTGFAIVASVTIALAAIREIRPVMIRAFLGCALALAVWSLDFYLVDLAPHWGQREIFEAYYRARQPGQHVIAWQMNWKGENFYTGNGVYTFVDLDTRSLVEWAAHHPGERVFVACEHSRVGSLRGTIHGATVTPLTTELDDNKFGIVTVDLPGTLGSAPAATPTPVTAVPALHPAPPPVPVRPPPTSALTTPPL